MHATRFSFATLLFLALSPSASVGQRPASLERFPPAGPPKDWGRGTSGGLPSRT